MSEGGSNPLSDLRCDDGNLINGDGCSAVCTKEVELNTKEVAEISTSKAGSLIFHLTDHLQSSAIDTDENGDLVQVLDYFPFGDERINEHAEDYDNDYRFTGKEGYKGPI